MRGWKITGWWERMRLAFIEAASATTAGVMSRASRARVTIVLPSPTSRPALSKSKAVEKGATASMMS